MATAELTRPDVGAEFGIKQKPWVPLLLVAGLLVFAIPTMIFVVRETWSGEQGAHSPIVLFTGLWLLWREWPEARSKANPPPLSRVLIPLGIVLPLFVLARITSIVEIEGYLMYGAIIIVLYSIIGGHALKKLWFPILYLSFIFPPPETVVAALTNPLKIGLSQVAISLLGFFGYPIGGEGVRIYIGQYELLVAAACSGLNSLISLTAISLFYIYIRHQAHWQYAATLALFIIPVALLANLVRVLILILLTYYAGESAAQGFLHDFAGLFMFVVALMAMFGLDSVLRAIWNRKVKHASAS